MTKNDSRMVFDSWKHRHKSPFGAVQRGEPIQFSVWCQAEHIQSVWLIVHKDFGEQRELLLEQEGQTGRYTGTFTPDQLAGLYFYHFRMHYVEQGKEKTGFYSNNAEQLGGLGFFTENPSDIRMYQLTVFDEHENVPLWYKTGVAYHIFVDRFRNGIQDGLVLHPKKNSFLYGTPEDIPMYIRGDDGEVDRWEFHGGNLLGIIEKLDDLKQRGYSILYLSPIFQAKSNHKYDTGDYFMIDEMFGTQADFRRLIKESQERGMHILLDGVFNHTGADSRYFNKEGTYPEVGAYQSQESPYADWYTFHSFPDNYKAWWGEKNQPVLNMDNPAVQNFIYKSKESVVRHWAREGIGGFRLDVVDELSDDTVRGIRTALEESAQCSSVLIGEVWEDASNKIAYGKRRHYLEGGMLQSVMNYPLRKLILAFIDGELEAREMVDSVLNLKENYPQGIFRHLFNNLGSHDTVRLSTVLEKDNQKVELAFALLLTLPGVPCVYYGDDVGVEGGKDPDNRRMYPWKKENQILKETVTRLIDKRRKSPALTQGTFHPFSYRMCFGYIREAEGGQWAVVLVNPTAEPIRLSVEEITEREEYSVKEFLTTHHLDALECPAFSYAIVTS